MSILRVDDVVVDGVNVSMCCRDGVIDAIGTDKETSPADDVLDGRGMTVVPPLVNGHTHAAMTLFRSFGDDMTLDAWLRTRIWPAEARLHPDDVYWGTRLACIEMIKAGVGRFFDMYWYAEEGARAARDSGIRMVASQLVFALDNGPPGTSLAEAPDGFDALGGFGPLVEPGFALHSVYVSSEADMRAVADLAGERSASVQIHLAETEDEVTNCVAEHGVRPLALLARNGLVHDRMVYAHGVWLDAAELGLIAARGATVVTNPVSNMKLAVGRAFPYTAARNHGVALGMGTDGAASNNSLDMFDDLKVFALLQKHAANDPSVAPAEDVWRIATGRCSNVMGGHAIEVGAPADFLLIDAQATELLPGALVPNLVYAASGSIVDSTVIAGRVVMRHREVADEAEVRTEVIARAARVRDE